jgi:hypothetical protein
MALCNSKEVCRQVCCCQASWVPGHCNPGVCANSSSSFALRSVFIAAEVVSFPASNSVSNHNHSRDHFCCSWGDRLNRQCLQLATVDPCRNKRAVCLETCCSGWSTSAHWIHARLCSKQSLWSSTGGVLLCWWAMPLWSWRTWPTCSLPPPPHTQNTHVLPPLYCRCKSPTSTTAWQHYWTSPCIPRTV